MEDDKHELKSPRSVSPLIIDAFCNKKDSIRKSNFDFRVLGLGNAIVDYNLSRMESNLFPESIMKSGVNHVEPEEFDSILAIISKNLTYEIMQPGGSAANTLRALAALGWKASFAGCVGKDKEGIFYNQCLKRHEVNPLLFMISGRTGRFLSAQIKDGNSLFIASPASAFKYPLGLVEQQELNSYDLIHLESHAALYPGNFVNLIQSIKNGKSLKVHKPSKEPKLSIDLASASCMKKVGPSISSVFPWCFDYVFANEEENHSVWSGLDLDQIASLLPDGTEYIVKCGERGAKVLTRGQIYSSPGKKIPDESFMDSVGAGDIFAAAYLNSRLHGGTIPAALDYSVSLSAESILSRGANVRQFLITY